MNNDIAWCEQRGRLDSELRMLLDQKTTIREQVSSEVALPGNRRTSLLKISAMIDDVLALLKAHARNCPCEAQTTSAADRHRLSEA
jgi:hypothetical protein